MDTFAQNARNRATWAKASTLRELDQIKLYTDPGEQAVMDHVREAVRGSPILDLGVGTGRTVPMLKPLTDDYRALDYTPEMVEASRKRYPDARIEPGDARDLGAYPANHFGLVNFSFSGIDAVGHADRRSILKAVRRVLAPRGLFVFSTLNLEGPSFRERPWRIRVWTRHPIWMAVQVVRQVVMSPVDLVCWLRIRDAGESGPGYAVAPLSAHHYGVLVHYTTLERQLRELAEEGFETDGPIFESRSGRRVSVGDNTSKSDWFHIVARRAKDPD